MVLTAESSHAEKSVKEEYSVTSVVRDHADFHKNPVIKKIEQADSLEGKCRFSAQTGIQTRVKGRTGNVLFYCHARMWSDGWPVRLDMRSKYCNPGKVFAGEVNVTLAYSPKADKKDIDKVRSALANAGLKPYQE